MSRRLVRNCRPAVARLAKCVQPASSAAPRRKSADRASPARQVRLRLDPHRDLSPATSAQPIHSRLRFLRQSPAPIPAITWKRRRTAPSSCSSPWCWAGRVIFTVRPRPNGLPYPNDTATVAKDGTIWIGADAGLYRFTYPFQVEYWDKTVGLPGAFSIVKPGRRCIHDLRFHLQNGKGSLPLESIYPDRQDRGHLARSPTVRSLPTASVNWPKSTSKGKNVVAQGTMPDKDSLRRQLWREPATEQRSSAVPPSTG
jgi:hypothetical protein